MEDRQLLPRGEEVRAIDGLEGLCELKDVAPVPACIEPDRNRLEVRDGRQAFSPAPLVEARGIEPELKLGGGLEIRVGPLLDGERSARQEEHEEQDYWGKDSLDSVQALLRPFSSKRWPEAPGRELLFPDPLNLALCLLAACNAEDA